MAEGLIVRDATRDHHRLQRGRGADRRPRPRSTARPPARGRPRRRGGRRRRPVPGGRLLGDEALTTGHPQAPLTARLTRPDGTPAWVWISSAPVLDAGGRPEGVVSTMSDVTQSREAEQRLVASESATRALADEQAALRRIATLVASEAPPSSVFERVTEEVARLLGAPSAGVLRYENDGTRRWSAAGATPADGHAAGRVARPRRGLGRRPGLPQRPSGAHRQLRRRAAERSRSICADSATAPRWPLRSPSAAGCGACWWPRRRGPRPWSAAPSGGCGTSPSSWRRPCPTPTPTTSSRAPARASWRPATPSGAGWSATSTTAPSSGSCRSRCSCAWSRGASRRNPDPRPPGSRRGAGAAQPRARGAARAGARHPPGHPHRRRPRPRPLGARPPRAAAGRDRRRARRAPARARRGRRLLPHRGGDHQRRQARRRRPTSR